MLGKKIIIDGLYKDDTTVVLYNHGVIQELRHQNATQNFVKGNIYLAKIEKIEPGLQAAFVNYDNGKSGFLQFSEIHPEYYAPGKFERSNKNEVQEIKLDQSIDVENNPQAIKQIHKQLVGSITGSSHRIQHLLKVDQTLLVQVEKDARGTKGASLTTFLSLSGRYCVLLLHSTKTNIVSKLVDDEGERERLKHIANELCMLENNISIMLKANAAYKTKVEIARDFGYLMRLWHNIQKHTKRDEAPFFIHEEGDVIKQSIRDLYNNEVEEIIVSGEEAYNNAVAFMKLLMPRYVNKIKHYKKPQPIFIEYNIHEQIKALYNDSVSLPSGGYLVINNAEALTSIDVNSGRSKNDDIEDTAWRINFEAAYEAVQQINLRNISGLIVIDFIDMISQENKDKIEQIVREGLHNYPAKTLITKMSELSLLEISRQRLGNSLYECVFHRCKHCNGRGRVRAFELTTIAILKAIGEEVSSLHHTAADNKIIIEIGAKRDVIVQLMNEKRREICNLEDQYNIKVQLKIDESATLDTFFVERKKIRQFQINAIALSTIDQTYYAKAPTVENIEVVVVDNKHYVPTNTTHEHTKTSFRKILDKILNFKILNLILLLIIAQGCNKHEKITITDVSHSAQDTIISHNISEEKVSNIINKTDNKPQQQPKKLSDKFKLDNTDDLNMLEHSKSIAVGVIAPMSGKNAMIGNAIMDGAHLSLISLFAQYKIPVKLDVIDIGSSIEDMELNLSKLDEKSYDILLSMTSEDERNFINAYLEGVDYHPMLITLNPDMQSTFNCSIKPSDQLQLIKNRANNSNDTIYIVLPITAEIKSWSVPNVKVLQYSISSAEETNVDLQKITNQIIAETQAKPGHTFVVFTDANWKMQKFMTYIVPNQKIQIVLASLANFNNRIQTVNEKRHKFGQIAIITPESDEYDGFLQNFIHTNQKKPLELSYWAYHAIQQLKNWNFDSETQKWSSSQTIYCDIPLALIEAKF